MPNQKPLLSIALITYNQEMYIADCIEGMINQSTTFPFEIVIGEDFSTDNTRKICQDYQSKYPNLIRILAHESNLGMMGNWIATINACSGEYIAICEGDDYWIDPFKLQKQIDFLNENTSFSLCATRSQIDMYGDVSINDINKDVLDTSDILLEDWGLMTATLVFRKNALQMPVWFNKVRNGDYSLQLLVSLNGLIKILPDVTSVYRIHEEGVSSKLTAYVQCAWMVFLLDEFNKTTNFQYKKQITTKIKRVYKNQMSFAKKYNLRRAYVKLFMFNLIRPIFPFLIKNYK